jgi:hypothetical protein
MRHARTAAATVGTAVLTITALLGSPQTAAASAQQPGPTQVINDAGSTGTAMIKDNQGKSFHVKRRGYVLHNSDTQFFTTFYVPRGTVVRFYATDPRGVVLPGDRLQEEKKAGWHQTNDQVDDADLVLIKIYSTVAPV